MTLFFLAALLAAAGPADPRTFGDWTVGCDNGRACKAVALIPEEGGEDWVTMSLERGAEAEARPRLFVAASDATPAGVAVDGRRLAARFVPREDGHDILPDQTGPFVQALRQGGELHLLGRVGRTARVSLKGAAAAMLYMDEQQKRVGSIGALAAPGRRADLSEAPPLLPRVRIAPAGDGAAIALPAARLAALRRETGCELEEVGGPDSAESFALASGRTLILLACGSGAYNVTHLPFIARREAGKILVAPALFDALTPPDETGRVSLVNADWDPKERRLSEFPRGRGLGDCGVRSVYGWDGSRFRLLEREVMGECRGSIDYIRIWRAVAVGG